MKRNSNMPNSSMGSMGNMGAMGNMGSNAMYPSSVSPAAKGGANLGPNAISPYSMGGNMGPSMVSPAATGGMPDQLSPIVAPSQTIYKNFYHTATQPIVHPVNIVNQHHTVPVPKHVCVYNETDVNCGCGVRGKGKARAKSKGRGKVQAKTSKKRSGRR
ncbi:hypothetical protein [Paenibacillus aquistagni]|uniref:Inner spore coat protein D n=1 Tax=Paenibacillus aquistagni TaxID=1852522 RepID=A0A1X7K8Z4_9BACL|nr:hypothetical protein [Paenibacillus aquistagni]NMM53630.1 hypothetical protein [Paenibacillus aquistagni]SMG36891.1 hypothetical protein SAMN06295960_2160 [Paenibacillus aquistagni]